MKEIEREEESSDLLRSLAEDISAYWVSSHEAIPILESPSALDFSRAVNKYKPCILRGTISHWNALNWSLDSIGKKCEQEEISVNFTPSGNADSVEYVPAREEFCFLYPADMRVKFSVFRSMLENRAEDDAVPYLSQQDDNLRRCFPSLLCDLEPSIPLADEIFGGEKLEAVNLWIGDERSVTSLHKDFYENMYAVLSGEKIFHLFPPTDVAFFEEGSYRPLHYRHSAEAEFSGRVPIKKSYLALCEECDYRGPSIPWIADDPVSKAIPLTSPLTCSVLPGDILYIPAMWYHRVTQTKLTIAVNYWYDMNFDHRFILYESARRLKCLKGAHLAR